MAVNGQERNSGVLVQVGFSPQAALVEAKLELVSMKRHLLALAATLSLATPLAVTAGDQGHHGRGGGDHGGSWHGGGERGGAERFGADRGPMERGGMGRGGIERGGGDRGGGREGRRPAQGFSDDRGPRLYDQGGRWGGGGPPGPTYRGSRWDDRRNNGYWMNSRWHYGPPPEDYYGRPGFALGFSEWHRGSYLPPYYRGWVVDDYARWRLRRPPYGYNWVRVGNDYLLVAAGSGLIFDIVRY